MGDLSGKVAIVTGGNGGIGGNRCRFYRWTQPFPFHRVIAWIRWPAPRKTRP